MTNGENRGKDTQKLSVYAFCNFHGIYISKYTIKTRKNGCLLNLIMKSLQWGLENSKDLKNITFSQIEVYLSTKKQAMSLLWKYQP